MREEVRPAWFRASSFWWLTLSLPCRCVFVKCRARLFYAVASTFPGTDDPLAPTGATSLLTPTSKHIGGPGNSGMMSNLMGAVGSVELSRKPKLRMTGAPATTPTKSHRRPQREFERDACIAEPDDAKTATSAAAATAATTTTGSTCPRYTACTANAEPADANTAQSGAAADITNPLTHGRRSHVAPAAPAQGRAARKYGRRLDPQRGDRSSHEGHVQVRQSLPRSSCVLF